MQNTKCFLYFRALILVLTILKKKTIKMLYFSYVFTCNNDVDQKLKLT